MEAPAPSRHARLSAGRLNLSRHIINPPALARLRQSRGLARVSTEEVQHAKEQLYLQAQYPGRQPPPDLPPSESADLRRAADASQVDLVFFVAPTSSEAGIEAACAAATGFVYCIAVTGVTGAREHLDAAVLPLIASVRRHTSLPVVVGFGISKPEHLAALEGKADGVIVASALLDAIGKAPDDPVTQVSRFLRELRPLAAR